MRAPWLILLTGLFLPMLALAQASDPIAAAQQRKAEAEAETAAANAEKAKWEAAVAAEKAKFGPLGTKAVDGSVEVGKDSGKFEATYLAAKSLDGLATKVVAGAAIIPAKAKVLILTGTEVPSFEGYEAFRIRVDQLALEFAKAKATDAVAKPKSGNSGQKAFFELSTTSAATAMDVLGNLFRADYKVAPLEVSLDDQLLVRAIIGKAHAQWDIRVPAYAPSTLEAPNPAVVRLNQVLQNRSTAARLLAEAKADAGKSKKLDYTDRIAALEGFIKSADAFSSEMRTPVSGVVPFLLIARQAQQQDLLEGGYLLSVKINAAGGSSVAKKNFWTFLGTMPFKVSGGAVASYAVFDGSSGKVLGGGIVQDLRELTPLTRVKD
jgi:hypothetical protein